MRGIIVVASLYLAFAVTCQASSNLNSDRAHSTYGNAPLLFVENRGQSDSRILFSIRGPNGTASFTKDSVLFTLRESDNADHRKSLFPLFKEPKSDLKRRSPSPIERRILRSLQSIADVEKQSMLTVKFIGASENAFVEGLNQSSAKFNFFIGNDPSKWRSDVNGYHSIVYRDLWRNIDLTYYGEGSNLKYDITVKPGGDVNDIRFQYLGADKVYTSKKGDLVICAANNWFTEKNPGIYQVVDGEIVWINGTFTVDEDTVGFKIDDYNKSLPLIIDPASDLQWSTFFGGTQPDYGLGVAIGPSNTVYIVGATYSSQTQGFPVKGIPAPFDGTFNGGDTDVFVAKFDPTKTSPADQLIYSTYLGGQGYEYFDPKITVDSSGNAYVTGQTYSLDFPVTASGGGAKAAYTKYYQGGYEWWNAGDAFVTKISPNGNALLYSTYLGGSDEDLGTGIALDSSNNVYVSGYTWSTGFPLPVPLEGKYAQKWGRSDNNAFEGGIWTKISVTPGVKYTITGWIKYFTADTLNVIAAIGYAAYDPTAFPNGEPPLSAVTWTNLQGGGQDHWLYYSLNDYEIPSGKTRLAILFKLKAGLGPSFAYADNVKVVKSGTTNNLLWNGGFEDGFTNPGGVAISWQPWKTFTSSPIVYSPAGENDVTRPNGYDQTHNGSCDGFLVKIDTNQDGAASLKYATFLGGYGWDAAWDVAVKPTGEAYVCGETWSPNGIDNNFPTYPTGPNLPYQPTYKGGNYDAFLSVFNTSGTALTYSTFLGGSGGFDVFTGDRAYSIAVDSAGAAYITGATGSADFPTTLGAYDTTFNGGVTDVFVTKIDPNPAGLGSEDLKYSTFIGGSSGTEVEAGYGIAVDSAKRAYVAGITPATNFPTTPGCFDGSFAQAATYTQPEAFALKLNENGTGLVYSTFLGHQEWDQAYDIAVEATSNIAYITGITASSSFPVSSGAYDTSFNGSFDAFIVKLLMKPVLVISLQYAASGSTTNPAPGTYVYNDNQSVTITATPAATQVLSKWIVNGEDRPAGPLNLTMDRSYSVVAVFAMKSGSTASFSAEGALVTASFENNFYIQSDNRTWGIQVVKDAHGVNVGKRVNVQGVVKTAASGEQFVEASNISVAPLAIQSFVEPLTMTNAALGGASLARDPLTGLPKVGISNAKGVNNIGLLVRIIGSVTFVDSKTFTISDGSGIIVKCVVPEGVNVSPDWKYAAVTGISSCEKVGNATHRLLKVRSIDDIDVIK